MKLVFFGDSLTDMYRNFDTNVDMATSYGTGFVFDISAHQDKSLTATSTKDGNYYHLDISGSGMAIDYSKKEEAP